MDVLTIGDTDIDLYMKIADNSGLPEAKEDGNARICFYHGSKVPVEQFETAIAGNSLNVGVGCTRLGLKTSVYTEVGDDDNGKRIVDELKKLGVDTSFCVKNKDEPTNVHSIIVYSADRTIFSYHAKRHYKIQNWSKPKWIYYTSLGNGFEEFQAELINYLQKNAGIGVAFNPGTIQMRNSLDKVKEFLKHTDVLFVNREEAIRLVGIFEAEDLHKELAKLGAKMSVITDGKNGATAYEGTNFYSQSIYTDNRPELDRTGAGDAFASGFLSAIFYGKSVGEALKWGAVNSGSAVKVIGAIKGLKTKDEIENIVKNIN